VIVARARRRTRSVAVGDVVIGGDALISVQSMTTTRTDDVAATVAQIASLESVGCEIARVAVPDQAAAQALPEILAKAAIPVVADVHFDYRLAVAAVEAGVHAVRINPGNIGSDERVGAVVAAAMAKTVPVRVGVNSGSLPKDILERDGRPTAAGMVEAALRHVELLERMDFHDVILSLKSSDVAMTVEANRAIAERTPYPLHLGITESGTPLAGAARSAVGIGILLAEGIGDTIRVSLAGPPEDEVRVGRSILGALGLRRSGVTVIACPTCGRAEFDVAAIAAEVERETARIRTPLVVAVMGCSVNGPGEAREADVGIAGGGREAVLFVRGEVVGKVEGRDAVRTLLERVRELAEAP
jgi:(E)-4-hydroxy-3-methylbut-2-enyl-diphosphate synthase